MLKFKRKFRHLQVNVADQVSHPFEIAGKNHSSLYLMSVFCTWLVKQLFFFFAACVCISQCAVRSHCADSNARQHVCQQPIHSGAYWQPIPLQISRSNTGGCFSHPSYSLSHRRDKIMHKDRQSAVSDIRSDVLRGGHLDLTARPSCCVA